MRVTIHQPNFIPRLKVLQKISNVDLWINLDSVQYVKQEWQNRTKIISMSDNEFWITVPVHLMHGSNTIIKDVNIQANNSVFIGFRKRLIEAFSGAAFRNEVIDYWDEVFYNVQLDKLSHLSTITMLVALSRYGTMPMVMQSSNLNVPGKKSELVVNLCNAVSAKEYIADSGALNYLKTDNFLKISVLWQDWDGAANLSCISYWRNTGFINLLARFGPNWLKEHLSDISLKQKLAIEKTSC